ncbi:ergothioneine biosynthesis protein EgtC [Oscillatoria sp. FACHB-1406]|uniref:ergothioneine biosynthesis protein EgtC n=1 Tax=Oscillatoria sp. FACHB-1406 TaxID=2692846 RepID=UPI00168A01EC|nr:ergothioneine biosynthesis protein EgtC [Oscillatoria sp. FACHB-1406]MBD2577261.1 ergothioneine biosynthesis protein EgtC [Oscillatoria sp. FACHB-1406]
MCRLLAYLGPSIQLDRILYKPEHSLIVQSYKPQEMQEAILNADGFGVSWYHPEKVENPYTYKSTQPIWNDINLPQLSRYVESDCILGYVRSATAGLAVDLSNCQPFVRDRLSFIHNGLIEKFRKTLYRPLCNLLEDEIYQWIEGSTDSEHLCALILNELYKAPDLAVESALENAIAQIQALASTWQVRVAANLIIATGNRLIASRHSTYDVPPPLYWLRDDPLFPNAVILASERLFPGDWKTCPEGSILSVGSDLEVEIRAISAGS